MAPYPMIQWPTLGEFIKRVTDSFGVTINETDGDIVGPRGPIEARFFSRNHEGNILNVPVPDISEEDRLQPTVLRYLCARLDIPLQEFGFHLGDTGWEEA